MATYQDIVETARERAKVGQGTVDDRTMLTLVWLALFQIIKRVATLSPNWPILPRITGSATVTEDTLMNGIAIDGMSNAIRILSAEVHDSNEGRAPLNIIDPKQRWNVIQPVPAAYVDATGFRPVPGDGRTQWNLQTIFNGGWLNVASVTAEWVENVARPMNLQDEMPLVDDFISPAISRVVWKLTNSAEAQLLYRDDMHELLASAGQGPADLRRTVTEVW